MSALFFPSEAYVLQSVLLQLVNKICFKLNSFQHDARHYQRSQTPGVGSVKHKYFESVKQNDRPLLSSFF